MAQKRMFDKKVVGSDKFLDLPNSSKALYFMAGMEADDKGFFQPRKLQKICGFSDDDYKILIAKGFFITFESGVMVVTDWNKNNWLDSRRITETEYIDELNLLKLVNQKYEIKGENDIAKPMLSEYSIEENRIEENSIDNIYAYIEKNFCRTLSPIEVEVIDSWQDNDLTRYAIKQAVLNGAYNIKYIDKILYNYKKNSITSVQQAQEKDKKFQNKKETIVEEKPEWFYYTPKNEKLTKEETQEMNDLLDELDKKIKQM